MQENEAILRQRKEREARQNARSCPVLVIIIVLFFGSFDIDVIFASFQYETRAHKSSPERMEWWRNGQYLT